MSATTVAAWIAVVVSAFGLGKTIYDLIKNRKSEQAAIEDALDKSPLVKQQLALGNVGEAVKHLNSIIDSQTTHIRGQDARIRHLEEREAALEMEAAGWESKYRGLEAEHHDTNERLEEAHAAIIALRNQLERYQQGGK